MPTVVDGVWEVNVTAQISIISVSPGQMAVLNALVRAMASEESPRDPAAPDVAVAEIQQALAVYDFSRSDSFWMLVAQIAGQPAGYAAVCRIPKADARAGFIFIDELHVLKVHRRRGVATALLARVEELARELGLAGVRLLARPENDAARRLYRSAGFVEGRSIFYEKRF